MVTGGHIFPNLYVNSLNGNTTWTASTTNIYYALFSAFTFAYSMNTLTDARGGGTETTNTAGAAYITGGQQLTSPTVSSIQNTGGGFPYFINYSSTGPQWTNATFSAAYGLVFTSSGVAGTSYLIAYQDYGGTQSVASNTFTVQFAGTGIFQLKAD